MSSASEAVGTQYSNRRSPGMVTNSPGSQRFAYTGPYPVHVASPDVAAGSTPGIPLPPPPPVDTRTNEVPNSRTRRLPAVRGSHVSFTTHTAGNRPIPANAGAGYPTSAPSTEPQSRNPNFRRGSLTADDQGTPFSPINFRILSPMSISDGYTPGNPFYQRPLPELTPPSWPSQAHIELPSSPSAEATHQPGSFHSPGNPTSQSESPQSPFLAPLPLEVEIADIATSYSMRDGYLPGDPFHQSQAATSRVTALDIQNYMIMQDLMAALARNSTANVGTGDESQAEVPVRRRSRLRQPWTTIKAWLRKQTILVVNRIPLQGLNMMLLFLPLLYFNRVTQIFKEVQCSGDRLKETIKNNVRRNIATVDRMQASRGGTRRPASAHLYFNTTGCPPEVQTLEKLWGAFIDAVTKEWKTMNLVTVLLVSAIIASMQIGPVFANEIVRYLSFAALVCGLMSMVYSSTYIIRFSIMRPLHKAVEWAKEGEAAQAAPFWNVWIFLSIPAIWLAWSLILFMAAIIAFMWLVDGPNDVWVLSSALRLAARVSITVVLATGLVYLALIINTLKRYGSQMDHTWIESINTDSAMAGGSNTRPTAGTSQVANDRLDRPVKMIEFSHSISLYAEGPLPPSLFRRLGSVRIWHTLLSDLRTAASACTSTIQPLSAILHRWNTEELRPRRLEMVLCRETRTGQPHSPNPGPAIYVVYIIDLSLSASNRSRFDGDLGDLPQGVRMLEIFASDGSLRRTTVAPLEPPPEQGRSIRFDPAVTIQPTSEISTGPSYLDLTRPNSAPSILPRPSASATEREFHNNELRQSDVQSQVPPANTQHSYPTGPVVQPEPRRPQTAHSIRAINPWVQPLEPGRPQTAHSIGAINPWVQPLVPVFFSPDTSASEPLQRQIFSQFPFFPFLDAHSIFSAQELAAPATSTHLSTLSLRLEGAPYGLVIEQMPVITVQGFFAQLEAQLQMEVSEVVLRDENLKRVLIEAAKSRARWMVGGLWEDEVVIRTVDFLSGATILRFVELSAGTWELRPH